MNIYMPFKAVIKEVLCMGQDVKLLKVVPEKTTIPTHPCLPPACRTGRDRQSPLSKGGREGFIDYSPGQFFMVSKWGTGEIPISVTSTNGLHKHIELGIKKVGFVTTALHQLKLGEKIWLRGPYGNSFATDIAKKRDIIFIAGGVGILPLRSLINLILIKKSQFGRLFLLYGSKKPSEILFTTDINLWGKRGLEVILTVDVKDERWRGNVGVVTGHLDKIKIDFKNACAYVCGPEIMIKNTIKGLLLRGMSDEHIVVTLEARMKCGIGKCGQCYQSAEYVCTNGPVYTYKEMKKRKVRFV